MERKLAAKRGGPSPTLDSATVRTQKDGTEVKRLTVYIPVDLARELSVVAAQCGVSVSSLMDAAVRDLIGGQLAPRPIPERVRRHIEATKSKGRAP
ncbi:MAG TPA: hypothetical protein VFT22_10995 [Kofleriaceae bacterium]|nr:hypothetical protein [Kofleriaceae bacterium]